MPSLNRKVCNGHGCFAIVEDGSGKCQQCTATRAKKGGWSKWQKRRGSRQDRGYGANWERVRAVVLRRDNHLCQECLRNGRVHEAKEVDHIKAKARGGSDAESNLEVICHDCHRSKTARESMGPADREWGGGSQKV